MTDYEQGRAAAQHDVSNYGHRFAQSVADDMFHYRHEEWAKGYRENV
jgi:hypothetical protein